MNRPRTLLVVIAAVFALGACGTKPLVPYSVDTPPLALVPASQAGVQDKRGRFREIYCAVLQARERDIPDYRPCEDALTRIGSEPAGTGRPVDLGCFETTPDRRSGGRHRIRMLRELAAATRHRGEAPATIRI